MSFSQKPPRTEPFDFDVSAWPRLPKAPGLFITGTDTDVGKTVLAGAIARSLRRTGQRVDVFKPIATGCRHDRGQLVSADADFLAACAESTRLLAEIAPVRYALPLAPNVAAEWEKRPVDLDAIFDGWRRLAAGGRTIIVEGIGGLLCPITDELWVVHLARLLDLPVVIVTRPGLGTINQTLLTIHAALSARLRIAGVVVNRYRADMAREGDADLAMQTNPAQIAQRGGVNILCLVPEDPATDVRKGILGPDVQFAIDQVDWGQIIRGIMNP